MEMIKKINSNSAETLTKWYLRFNGYFTVDNFIVHAGDDSSRISNGNVGNYTEVDVLAIRNKFSKEVTGQLSIVNDEKLISNQDSKIDFIIAETKTGNEIRPNKIWRNKNVDAISYIVRFAGFIENEGDISKIAKELAENNFYTDPNNNYSVRLVIFSESPLNKNWNHVTNINFNDIIDFLVDVRGECWVQENLGVVSLHQQWDGLINEIFKVANDQNKERAQRKSEIEAILKRE